MEGLLNGRGDLDDSNRIMEIDNWGVSNQPGQAKAGGIWIWGYDEITWFAHQTKEYRANWLRHAWDWVRRTDPNLLSGSTS